MSTTNINSSVEELLKSFDLLLESEKRQAASEILRRTYASSPELDEAQLAAAYADLPKPIATWQKRIEGYEKGFSVRGC